jgi:hypothetical protein
LAHLAPAEIRAIMRAPITLILLGLLTMAGQVAASDVHLPRAGSAERSAILNAARPKVAADLGYRGRLLFKVESLRAQGDWALLIAQPIEPSGTPIQKGCLEADEVTVVLLKRAQGAWRVERGGTTCATDVFWLGWQDEVGAPAEIFQLD